MTRSVTLVLTVLIGAPLAAEDRQAPVALRGRVTDAQTGEPIAGLFPFLPSAGLTVEF